MRMFLAASLLALCLTQTAPPDAHAQSPAPEDFTSLSLFAEPEKTEVTLGQPVTVRVRLTNLTDSDVAARPDLDPAYGAIQVYVSRNSGEFKRYLGPGWGAKDRPGGAPLAITPGASVLGEVTLLFHHAVPGRDDLLESSVPIEEAGSYVIRVELYDETYRRRIVAPAFGVHVWFPQDEAGQAVWRAVEADSKLAYFMQTGDARQADGVVRKAEQLVESYADNNYKKQLSLALGRHYLSKGKVETAIRHLKDAAAAEPSSSLRARALLELARSYAGKGETDEALKISDAVRNELNDGEVRQEFDRLGLKLRQGGKPPGPK